MITSSNADFNEDGFGSVVRDLERAYLMLAELGVQGGDSPASTVINYNSELGGGNATMTPAVMGDTLFSSGGSTTTGVTGGITKIPDLVGDVIGSITSNVIANGAVTAAKMANSIGCSVLGRDSNSSGVLGDITSSQGTVLCRYHNLDFISFSSILSLGSGGNDGKIDLWHTALSSAPYFTLDPTSISPTGGWSTTKQIKIREVDAVESGIAKKILLICSIPY